MNLNEFKQASSQLPRHSRQHLVNLLEAGKIAYHRAGTHRRVTFKDLLEFESKRDAERRTVLEKASDELDDAGLYDTTSPPEDVEKRPCSRVVADGGSQPIGGSKPWPDSRAPHRWTGCSMPPSLTDPSPEKAAAALGRKVELRFVPA